MRTDTISSRTERLAHDPRVHAGAVLFFLLVNGLGYALAGGLGFVQGWGGGLAAIIATVFLVWKSQGYWAWMVVNAGLWCALFFHMGLPMLGWLQVALLVFASYGFAQWALVRLRIGWDPRVPTDALGGALGLALLAFSLYAYRDMPGYTWTAWWWLELGSVVTAIAAMWMDAFRYKLNWWAWSLSNVCFFPLSFHGRLWGPFVSTFVYQAINVYGWFVWVRDERRLRALAAYEDARNPSARLVPDATLVGFQATRWHEEGGATVIDEAEPIGDPLGGRRF